MLCTIRNYTLRPIYTQSLIPYNMSRDTLSIPVYLFGEDMSAWQPTTCGKNITCSFFMPLRASHSFFRQTMGQ